MSRPISGPWRWHALLVSLDKLSWWRPWEDHGKLRVVLPDTWQMRLAGAILTLTAKERLVLILRFGFDEEEPVGRWVTAFIHVKGKRRWHRYGRPLCVARTYEEVGKKLGVTRERIRQIEAKALRKLRHPSRYPLDARL